MNTDKNFSKNYDLGHTNLFLFMIHRMDLDYKSAQINMKAAEDKGEIKEYYYWRGVADQLTTSMNDLKTAQISACGNANWERICASNSNVQVLESK